MIVFNNALHSPILGYIEFVRKKILCQWKGWTTRICYIWRVESEIQLSLFAALKLSGINRGSKGGMTNSTSIWKFTTTKVQSYALELKKHTANHMCHSLKTVEENYFLTGLQTRAGEISLKIQEVQRRKPKEMEKYSKRILKTFLSTRS